MPERILTYQDIDLTVALFQNMFGLMSHYLIEAPRPGVVDVTFQVKPPDEFVEKLQRRFAEHGTSDVIFRIYCVKSLAD